jgi:hypothetical protein
MEEVELPDALIVPHIPKSIILCLYKSIQDDIIEQLSKNGKVIVFGQEHLNRPIYHFPFDYFIIDLRVEEQRFYFQRHISRYHIHYYFVLYRHSFETDNGIQFDNHLTEFPHDQVSKEEFDGMLLENPLPAPNCLLSLCKYLFCK